MSRYFDRLRRRVCVQCGNCPPTRGKRTCARCRRRNKTRDAKRHRANPKRNAEYLKKPSTIRRYRDWYYRRMYNITLVQYKKMGRAQEWRCAICKRRKRLGVDHCHTTGRVRGLLCVSCNSAIGHLFEDEKVIIRAIMYLRIARRRLLKYQEKLQ